MQAIPKKGLWRKERVTVKSEAGSREEFAAICRLFLAKWKSLVGRGSV